MILTLSDEYHFFFYCSLGFHWSVYIMDSYLLVCNFTAAGPAYNLNGQVTTHCLSREAFTNLLQSSSALNLDLQSTPHHSIC